MTNQSKIISMLPKEHMLKPANKPVIISKAGKADEFKELIQDYHPNYFHELLSIIMKPIGKKSFLVFKNNKYFNVLTENIALFYVKHESSIIRTFDNQEYFVNHSLEQIQNFLPANQFYRLNRQYLVNFSAIKDVEHYFARKLQVNLVVPIKEKLLVSKEKVHQFLGWLDSR